ncbi:MAG TPA: S4 domain-containing protein [Steroidobacteraceae bacterium]|jgi:23S rRNA pseudouridine2605 synthase
MASPGEAQRLQKVLSQIGVGSRREAEAWIRAGRLTVNDQPAVLGMRVHERDQLKLDGRLIRRRPATEALPVFLCHRSPGVALLPGRSGERAAASSSSFAERMPRRAGRRFLSVSPMPTVDGGLELLTADGALAARLQRAVRSLESEFSLRVRGQLSDEQRQGVLQGELDRGIALRVLALEAAGGEGSNRWYRLVTLGASGNDVRQLIERQAVTLVRMLRTRLGKLTLPRTLARGRWAELDGAQLSGLLGSRAAGR